jgi:hypothetical protein
MAAHAIWGSKMIIFLGAGASRAFEIPTTRQFIKLFEQEIGENELYKDVKATIREDLFDLESLMSVLSDLSRPEEQLLEYLSPYTSRFLLHKQQEQRRLYYQKAGVQDAAKELLRGLKNIIRRECLTAVRDRKPLIIETYDRFFDTVSGLTGSSTESPDALRSFPSDLRIFTTNYDTSVETYLNAKHADFTSGVELRWGYLVLNVNAFSGRAIELVKLHGSIDLFRKNDDVRQLQTYGTDIHNQITYLGEDYGEEFMVYPIEPGSLRHVIQSPYSDLYNLLRDRLTRENTRPEASWLLIGSSLRDLAIPNIMNEVLRLEKTGERPLIVLIDINPASVLQRLRDNGFATLADRISPLAGKFGEENVFEHLGAIRRK